MSSSGSGTLRALLYAALVVLYLLHNDLWLWHDSSLVLGLPVGLTYHVVYCLVAAALLGLVAHFAWPEHLEDLALEEAAEETESTEEARS